MAKPHGKLRIHAEYAGVLLGCAVLGWLPLPIAAFLARLLADVWRLIDRRHRTLAIEQSMDRLGIGLAEAKRLVKKNYRHYGLFILEIARLRRMTPAEAEARTDINGCDRIIEKILEEKKGLIVVTGHLGNWEWGAVVLGRLGGVDGMLARPLDNPLIDRLIRKVRESGGAAVWDKFGGMRRALAAVKAGRGFVAVVDQDGGRKGHRAYFLDKDSSTMSTPVDLAVRTGAPLFVGAIMRTGGAARFTMIPKRTHWPRPGADPEDERHRLTTEINADLSEIIRAYPEQWIWIHRRWKTRPHQHESVRKPARKG